MQDAPNAAARPPRPDEVVAVVGLGYVGLPVAVAMGSTFEGTIGFDVDDPKVRDLQAGHDRTHQIDSAALRASGVTFASDPSCLEPATFYIVAVPTPVDANRRPDLQYLESACTTIGPRLKRGDVVVFESTVYPGVTEEVCGTRLAEMSGMTAGLDFHLAYSPERVNPGDSEHTLESIVKVVAAQDTATLDRVAAVYTQVVRAGVHRAPSIRVAEAAKVIENTQRDLNIALMNELAIIFDRVGIRTRDVLAAARTKWNFLPFTPGLVGGHCIGVDPYYLTHLAERHDYHPQVILSGRRINDGTGAFVATKCVKLLASTGRPVTGARVGVIGLTFKENVPDLRNSRVPDIVRELAQFGISALVHEPLVDAREALAATGIDTVAAAELRDLDALILAVPHDVVLAHGQVAWTDRIVDGGILIDVKAALDTTQLPEHLTVWSL